MLLDGDFLRNDAAGMYFADATPQERFARPPGADRRCWRILRLLTSSPSLVITPEDIMFAPVLSPMPTPSCAVNFGDAPHD